MISIIVPIYKVEEYLARCVDSVLAQTFRDFELILVDDGSPDGCPGICDAYAAGDPRIRVVHKENGGLSDARNAGLSVAKGDLIAFIDSDDWVAPDFLRAMYDTLTRERADIVECRVVKTDGSEEHVAGAIGGAGGAGPADAGAREAGAPPVPQAFDTESALRELIYDGVFHQTVWNKLYRREVLDGILFAVGRLNEDEFWTYQVFARAGKVLKLDRPLYFYFQRPGSIMGASYSLRRLDALDAKLERQAFFEEHFPNLARTARLNLASTCLFSGQMSLRYLSGDERKAAREKIDSVWAQCRPSSEDLKPLSFRSGLWLCLARLSFWGTARLKCILRRGF
jgi:glycosyltransferase involved in cell wall biosynthesis